MKWLGVRAMAIARVRAMARVRARTMARLGSGQ